MRILTAVRAEFARLTSTRMGTLALVALMSIPVAYGGLYLWGNHDPYGALDRVPAALVVADEGTTVDGEAQNYGRDAADGVLDDARFDWQEVTAAEASAGVSSGRFDFALEFPADFSRDLASSGDLESDADPVRADLGLLTDDTNSYLSTTIAKQAATAVRAEVTETLGRSATLTLLDGLDELRSGLSDAADGAGKLADGTASARSGSADLRTGADTLTAGATSLDQGLQQLQTGTADLPAQATQLSDGAASLATGLGSASDAIDQLAGVAEQTAALAQKSRADVEAALTAAGVPAEQQAGVLAELDGLVQAGGGTSAIATGLQQSTPALTGGAQQLAAGAGALAQAAPALRDGVASAASGAHELAAGSSSLDTGAADLASGLATLDDGATQLRDELADGVTKAPATTADGRTAASDAIADPLAVDQTAITEAADYGAGLAPFFIALAGWIGIYALFLLVRPLSRRSLTAVRRPVSTALAGWATPAVLGVAQMAALFAVVTLALGLAPAHPVAMLGVMALLSLTFAAIVQALNVWLGSVGQFLGLLLMVVQLVTAGGTFPWQTLPAPLAALHQVLPMSHAVDALRIAIYGGGTGGLPAAVLPLVAWMLAALAISVAGAARQSRFRTLRELRPSPLAG